MQHVALIHMKETHLWTIHQCVQLFDLVGLSHPLFGWLVWCLHAAYIAHIAGIVGDSGVGKTSLMVKYVEGRFDTDYNETIGVQFLEKQLNAAGECCCKWKARTASICIVLHFQEQISS